VRDVELKAPAPMGAKDVLAVRAACESLRREETKKRGSRPDRHEVWATTIRELSALEAVQHVVFIEAILDTVKEALLARVELSEEAARESEVRTAHLMKLLDLIH